jgi:hypothetical protein
MTKFLLAVGNSQHCFLCNISGMLKRISVYLFDTDPVALNYNRHLPVQELRSNQCVYISVISC